MHEVRPLQATCDPAGWAVPWNGSVTHENAQFREIREWSRFYVFESFRVRPARLGSIELHPDFE